MRLSPDGQHLAFLAPRGDSVDAFVLPASQWGPRGLGSARRLSDEGGRGIAALWWSADGAAVVLLRDARGDESWQLCAIELSSGACHELTPASGANARLVAIRAARPGWIAVALNDRDPRWHDLWAIEVTSGQRELLWRNDHQAFGFVVDHALVPRFAMRAELAGRTLLHLRHGLATPWRQIAAQDEFVTQLVGQSLDGQLVYSVSAAGRELGALVAAPLAAPSDERVLAQDPSADVAEVVFLPERGEPLAACFEASEPRWVGIGAHEDAIRWLCAAIGGAFTIDSVNADGSRCVVTCDAPDRVPEVRVVDLSARVLGPAVPRWPALGGATCSPMRHHRVRARDGLELTTYVTEPVGARPSGGWPAVVWVHGGPWRRDGYRFDSRHQWLADRGLAVVAVNFRGSTGQGKAFVAAGDLEWGQKMQTDLYDAVAALADRGVIDAARTAICGGSYGGYAALAALAFAPTRFACGVSICGPSNLETSQTTKPAYWAPVLEQRARRIGDPRTAAGRALLRERSPLHAAGAICRPLLVAHGANDPRVSRAESDQVVRAASAAGARVTYVVFGDEGHGLAREGNRVAFYAIMEAFLAEHLGVTAEPIADALERACVEVVAGAEAVAGLAAALARSRA